MDYYPFGMGMPERQFSASSTYKYGFNEQEKSDEVSEKGNHTTAKYWEYDSRLGRRWNLDPIYNEDISRYAANGNNPNYYKDPLGDFKTKFGAQVYKFFHGGNVRKATVGKHAGEWYVSKRLQGLQGRKGHGKLADGSIELDEVIVGGSATYSWGKGNRHHPGNVVDNAADGANKSVDYIKNNASEIWNSPAARAIIPDYYSFSYGISITAGTGISREGTFTILLRGADPGIYHNKTISGGLHTSAGIESSFSLGKGYYLGDIHNFSSKALGGPQYSVNVGAEARPGVGIGVGAGLDFGLDDRGNYSTITTKFTVSGGMGIASPISGTFTNGYASPAIQLIKFKIK